MAGIYIGAFTSFLKNETKYMKCGENHNKSNHVESFTYSSGIIKVKVKVAIFLDTCQFDSF